MAARITLMSVLLAALVHADGGSSSITTLNTDPIWNSNIFWANPPVVGSDLNFVNQMGLAGTTCYQGSASTNNNCYSSSLSGSLTILNESASQSFAGLILQPTFASAPFGFAGSVGGTAVSSASLQSGAGRILDSSTSAPLTSQYNSGDFGYIFVRMSDYFGGIDCGSNPNQSNCVLNPNQTVSIPYSFVSLPANVIFNVYGVGTNRTIYDTNPNSSTTGILATINGGLGGRSSSFSSSVPEPGTLLLFSSGVLVLWRARRQTTGGAPKS